MKKVLVLCTGNSCRSQMAHGYLEKYGAGYLEVWSAGVETHGLNPRAVAVMKEDGIDISAHTSNHVDEYRDIAFDYVITVCDSARERCPVFPAATKQVHVSFPDPAKAPGSEAEVMQQFRKVRDQVSGWCVDFTRSIKN